MAAKYLLFHPLDLPHHHPLLPSCLSPPPSASSSTRNKRDAMESFICFASSAIFDGRDDRNSAAADSSSSYSPAAFKDRRWKRKIMRCCRASADEGLGAIQQKPSVANEQALRADLEAAIRSEDYSKAAALRDELRLLQEDCQAAVLTANNTFYRAFENADMNLMQKIWAKGENVHCIHPGAGCISGYELVIASWEVMLGTDPSLQLRIELKDVEVHVNGDMGFVTCLEVVRTSGRSWGKQVATNIFERQNGSWVICMHHASHISP